MSSHPAHAKPSLSNALLELSWTPQGLSLIDRTSGRTVFHNATFRADDLSGCVFPLSIHAAAKPGALVLTANGGALEATLRCTLDGPCLRCSVELHNCGTTPILLGDVEILRFERTANSVTHLLANPVDVFSLGAVTGESELTWSKERRNKKRFALTLDSGEPEYASDNVFCARPADPGSLTPEATFSFDRIGDVACGVVIDLESGISRARAAFRGAALPAGARRVLPALFVDGLSPTHEAISAAAERVSAVYRPKVSPHVPSGWCSWYYYYTHITEEAILENLCCADALCDRLPIEYVQIDDGYQRHWGDWLQPSGKFPHDMAWMAREIKALGFKPGIWVAPLIMTVQSDLFKAHPGWALRRFETGEPYTMEGWSPKDENPWVILDATHPDVLAHLKGLFAVMAHEWGYEYFKLDAIAFGAYSGIRHRPELTGEQAIRLAFEAIREAVGPEKYILGCGAPFGSVVGIVDGSRVSDDVSTAFRIEQFVCPMEVSLPQSIHRSFIHGKWWHNDPDCVLVRRDGTPHQGGLDRFGLTLEEARFFVTAVGLTQGIQMIGENLAALDDERLGLLETIQPPLPSAGQPLDLFSPHPERILAKMEHGTVLGILNWNRESKRHAVDIRELGIAPSQPLEAYELWTQCHVSLRAGEPLEMDVPAQGCRLLLFRCAADHPQFLGFDGHLSCGASLLREETWDAQTGTLHLIFGANRPGTLQISTPSGWVADDPALAPCGERAWATAIAKGENRLRFQFRPALS